ncbi:hypothetical protein ACHAW5_004756 [Stephanodiscus triporus]|uniref:Mitochondrial splicing suppressor 51-like C-terminal domain-containing protein n=1 Tax=Stephanodiscus triporus TaxID=2934178 RepID=A0ABD3MKQ7_9STRA
MDLLASLGLGTDLPEQSTRLTSHPGIIKALDNDDDDVRLGFNRCLRCGVRLSSSSSSDDDDCDENDDEGDAPVDDGVPPPSTTTDKKRPTPVGGKKTRCGGCGRVAYCSPSCAAADARPSSDAQDDDYDGGDEIGGWGGGCGHSPVICSLLALCDDDEDAEDEFYRGGGGAGGGGGGDSGKRRKRRRRIGDRGKSGGGRRREAARYRVWTERESYPATLFNVLSEGPDWFVEAITRRLRRNADVRSPRAPKSTTTTTTADDVKRRGKRDRSSALFGVGSAREEREEEGGGATREGRREVVLHVVGASADSELWGWDGKRVVSGGGGGGRNGDEEGEDVHVTNAYAEASANLSSYLEDLLQIRSVSIRCVFVGPDCPPANASVVRLPIPDSRSSTLTIETHRCDYGGGGGDDARRQRLELPAPDAIVFFNPGFSCTDYDWSDALSAASSWPTGGPTPFLIATNTEIEGYADVGYMLDGGHVDPRSLPADVLEAMDRLPVADDVRRRRSDDDDDDDDDDDHRSEGAFLFRMNPYAGLRVRQSGTMGNDLYVKNRWIVCGLFRGGGLTEKRKDGKPFADGDDDGGEEKARKRRRDEARHEGPNGKGGAKNATKRKNPALI